MKLIPLLIISIILISCSEKKVLLPLRLPSFVREVPVDMLRESHSKIKIEVSNFNSMSEQERYWDLIKERSFDVIFIPDKSDEAIIFFNKNPNVKNLYLQNTTLIDYPTNNLNIIRTFPFNSEIAEIQRNVFELSEYQVLNGNEKDFKTTELAKIWSNGNVLKDAKKFVMVGEGADQKFKDINGLKLYSTPIDYNDIKESEENIWYTLIYSPYFEFGESISSCDFEGEHRAFSKRERTVDYHSWYLYQAILTYDRFNYAFNPKLVFYNPYLKTYIIPDGLKECSSNSVETFKVINYSEYKNAKR